MSEKNQKEKEITQPSDLYVRIYYDKKGTIGKRYFRQDEIGTPFCFTIDGQTFVDGTVTVRYRDTRKQERIHISKIAEFIKEKIKF
jgi:glycyl-tRNA synthetase